MSEYAKAIIGGIVGFAVAFLSALLPYVQDGSSPGPVGWITASIAGLVSLGLAGGTVYATPNTKKE